ncbi:MFS transporter [Exiguobacterium oxidotolerans]|uniref:MFS transporter n=1 Tax=Exiguobacterium oxidotolerans TaxID=223958 RepID=UPI000A78AFAA|nr:MFS transporter [Exiguobacterium oxidotolerans]
MLCLIQKMKGSCFVVSRRFALILSIVFISGFTQGLLIPLLSILLERQGTPAYINGLSAAVLYIGVIVAAPLMEKPLRRHGYVPVISFGLSLVAVAVFAFPLLPSVLAWMVLRFIVGFGDQTLHYGSQVWVTSITPNERLGRTMSLYGMAFGLGFALGPLAAPLVDYIDWLPFVLTGTLTVIVLVLLRRLPNEKPTDIMPEELQSAASRYRLVLASAWFTLLPGFTYGFLEATLNASFPVFATRNGYALSETSALITTFVVSSLIMQLPLGRLADHFGKRRTLITVLCIGASAFLAACFFFESYGALFAIFAFSGMALGSTYSLGVAYMTEQLPSHLLPTGNLLAGISFSLGSILGPIAGSVFVLLPPAFYFSLFVGVLFTLAYLLFRSTAKPAQIK